jgi:hypothetical protein
VDGGGNLLVAATINPSDLIREIAVKFGVDFDAAGMICCITLPIVNASHMPPLPCCICCIRAGTAVIDHLNFDPTDLDHTTILTSTFVKASSIVGNLTSGSAPVMYHGVGQVNIVLTIILVIPYLTIIAWSLMHSHLPQFLHGSPLMGGAHT